MTRWPFAEFVLDLPARRLLRGAESVPLSPKACHLLEILVRNAPQALTKAELQDRLWPGTFVVEKNLANLVGEIRSALGDDTARTRFSRTVPRLCYGLLESSAGWLEYGPSST